jgi:hypothetical protein
MRSSTLVLAVSALTISSTLAYQRPGLFNNLPPPLDHYRELYRQREATNQATMNPGPLQPPVADAPSTGDNENGDTLTLSDVLPKTRSINIFASLTRDISSVTGRLESTLATDNTTLLAPLNSAMQSLPRKPWEDRPDDASGVSAARNEDKAAENLRRFVEEHVVPTSPWVEGQAGKIKTLGGQEVWWEKENGKKVIMPGRVEVDGVVGKVGNGQLWALKGVMNYQ